MALVAALLLGLPLLASALILFVPIRYRLLASDDGGVSFHLSWLLGFFRLRYERKSLHATVLWFKKVGSNKRKIKKKSAAKKTETVKESPNKWQLIVNAWKHPARPEIWNHGKTLLRRTLRALKPRVFRLRLRVGFDDPAITGMALGVLGIVQGVWRLDMNVTGSFDEVVLRYELCVRDRLALWSLFWPFIAFSVKKPVRRLIIKYIIKKDDRHEPNPKPDI